ncbi:hypothetical protein [Microtetraspora niveoalba]|uniref:hypothetical protein n=1 Tax=Microtetraspora niveoalba TaxID=46175 RepID=UPI0012FC62B9|nr:hypothetical protein [Microtetraspora niveoalba]
MSGTSRSIRGRHAVLATMTAGVSWFASGPAVAAAGPCAGETTAAVCEAALTNGPARAARTITIDKVAQAAGLPGLSSAAGVLSIADAGGAAAGQGLPGLPGTPPAAGATSVAAGLPRALAVPVRIPELPDVPALPAIPARPDATGGQAGEPAARQVPGAQPALDKQGRPAKRHEQGKRAKAERTAPREAERTAPREAERTAPKAPGTRPGKKDGAVAEIAKKLIDTTVLP